MKMRHVLAVSAAALTITLASPALAQDSEQGTGSQDATADDNQVDDGSNNVQNEDSLYLNDLLDNSLNGSFNITAARQLVAGYETLRPLSGAERGALPVLAHGAAMRFFLSRLQDWGATPEGALVKPKDPLEYERKLAVHRSSPDLVLFGAAA